jgi:putative oxidoreductase
MLLNFGKEPRAMPTALDDSRPTHRAGGLYCCFSRMASKGQSPFLLLIRVYIGYQCVKSGVLHLHHFQQTVDAFKSWDIPFPTANVVFSGLTEIVGGSLLLLGLVARLASLALVGNFTVAFLAVNLSDPHYRELLHNFWNNQDVLLKDDAFAFLMTSIIVLIFGPGIFSLDGMIRRRLIGRPVVTPLTV